MRRLDRLRGWIEAAHPFPLLAVLLLTALVALASAAGRDPDTGRLALVLLAMLLSQLAIGWTNDYVDRETDRLTQPSKPIASGRLDPAFLPLAIIGVTVAALAVGAFLGTLAMLFLVVGTLAGLGYDLWLKQTHWSWLPFIVAFTVLPPSSGRRSTSTAASSSVSTRSPCPSFPPPTSPTSCPISRRMPHPAAATSP